MVNKARPQPSKYLQDTVLNCCFFSFLPLLLMYSQHGISPQLPLHLSFTVLAWAPASTSLSVRGAPNAPLSLLWGADEWGVSDVPPAVGRSAATANTATTWGSLVGLAEWRRAASWDSVSRWVVIPIIVFANVEPSNAPYLNMYALFILRESVSGNSKLCWIINGKYNVLYILLHLQNSCNMYLFLQPALPNTARCAICGEGESDESNPSTYSLMECSVCSQIAHHQCIKVICFRRSTLWMHIL